jgi:subtilase family serine protease
MKKRIHFLRFILPVCLLTLFLESTYGQDIQFDSLTVINDTITPGGVVSQISYVQSMDFMPSFKRDYYRVFNNQFVISKDTILDSTDISVGTDLIDDYTGFDFVTGRYFVSRTLQIYLNQVIPQGKYYLIGEADYLRNISESNESNNFITSEIFVKVVSMDLSIQVDQPPLVGFLGNPVTIKSEVTNLGQETSTGSVVGYYLSSDSLFDSGDLQLGFGSSTGNLVPNQSLSLADPLYLPVTIIPGNYFILLNLDPYGSLPETNELNNFAIKKIEVLSSNPDLENNPDLTVTILDTVQNVFIGSTIFLSGSENNIGGVAAGAHFVGYYLSSDSTLDENDALMGGAFYVPVVDPNSSFLITEYVQIPENINPGTYYLFYKVNLYPQNVAEANVLNNIAYKQIKVLPSDLDLTIQINNVNLSSYGQQITPISITVFKSNTQEIYTTYSDFYISADSLKSSDDQRIGFGQSNITGLTSVTDTIDVSIPSYLLGKYYIIAEVNTANGQDIDLSNNAAFTKITILPNDYDLSWKFTSTDMSAVPGDLLWVNCEVTNSGPTQIHVPYDDFLYLSTDTLISNDDILLTRLTYFEFPGDTTIASNFGITIPGGIPYGNYYLIVETDADGLLQESNENNNLAYVPVEIRNSGADLEIASIVPSTGNVITGSTVGISISVHNLGTSPSVETIAEIFLSQDTLWDVSDIAIAVMDVPYISAGGTVVSTMEAFIPDSTSSFGYLLARADAGQIVWEINEGNNVAYTQITIKEGEKDLAIQKQSLSKSSINREEIFTATATIVNSGNTIIPYTNMEYYLSADKEFSTDDVLLGNTEIFDLGSNSNAIYSSILSVPSDQPTGNFNILFVVDPFNDIIETNEQNNVASKGIKVKTKTKNGNPLFAGDFSGLKNLLEFALSVAPNPVKEILTVLLEEVETGAEIEITLFNLLGEEVKAFKNLYNGNDISFSTTGLGQGVYILQVKYLNSVKTIRILKE